MVSFSSGLAYAWRLRLSKQIRLRLAFSFAAFVYILIDPGGGGGVPVPSNKLLCIRRYPEKKVDDGDVTKILMFTVAIESASIHCF